MKFSLYQRLALSLCFAFVLLASILFYWSNSLAEHSKFQAEQKLHSQLAEHLAHDNPLLQDGVYDKDALKNLFHTFSGWLRISLNAFQQAYILGLSWEN